MGEALHRPPQIVPETGKNCHDVMTKKRKRAEGSSVVAKDGSCDDEIMDGTIMSGFQSQSLSIKDSLDYQQPPAKRFKSLSTVISSREAVPEWNFRRASRQEKTPYYHVPLKCSPMVPSYHYQQERLLQKIHNIETCNHVLLSSSYEKSSSATRAVKFVELVLVQDISSHRTYSEETRLKIWTGIRDIEKQAKRNTMEFCADGEDWRYATEENDFCKWKGELVHPYTFEKLQEQQEKEQDEVDLQTNKLSFEAAGTEASDDDRCLPPLKSLHKVSSYQDLSTGHFIAC